MIFKLFFNLLKTILKVCFNNLNKFWVFKIIFKTLSLFLWPISFIFKILGYYKQARTIFVIIAFLLGVNLDLDHLNFSMLTFSSFFTKILDKLIDILLKILTTVSQWLYNIQVNRLSNNVSTEKPVELVDHYIFEEDSNFTAISSIKTNIIFI